MFGLRLAAAMAAVVMGCALLHRWVLRQPGLHSESPLSHRYSNSQSGRRLGQTLRSAGLGTSPYLWRRNQLLGWLLLVVLSVPLAGSVGYGISAAGVRWGSSAVLRIRALGHRRRLQSLEYRLAQCLLPELRLQRSLAEAVIASQSTAANTGDMTLVELLTQAGQNIRVGMAAGHALRLSAAQCLGRPLCAGEPLDMVITALAVDGSRTGRVESISHLAAGLHTQTQHTATLRSSLTEVRFVAVAVPLVSAALAASLLASGNASFIVLESSFGLTLALVCVAAVVFGVNCVLKLTRL